MRNGFLSHHFEIKSPFPLDYPKLKTGIPCQGLARFSGAKHP